MGSKYSCDLRWLGLRPSQLAGLSLLPDVMQSLSERDYAKLGAIEALLSSSDAATEASKTGAFKKYW